MVSALVNDALTTLAALDGASLDEAQNEAVGLLALVAGQDVELGDEEGTWRIASRTAPDRMVSVIDPDSRHVHKTVHNYRDGFKAHMAIEPDTGLITACSLTPGNVGDAEAGIGLLEGEPAHTEVLTRPMARPSCVGPFRRTSTRRSSSRCRCTMRSRVASAPTTSSST